MSNDTRRSELGSAREIRPGKWQARITRGTRIDGKPRTLSKTFGSEGEARQWLAAMHVKLDGDGTALRGITVGALWLAYEDDRRGRLANSTLNRYAWSMRKNILPIFGDVDASCVTVSMVQSMLDGISGRREAQHSKAALSSVLTWAVRHDILLKNPIRSARFAYPGDEGPQWENEELFDVDPFAAIKGVRNVWDAETALMAPPIILELPIAPVWLAMVGAGARLEEAFALRPIDVQHAVVRRGMFEVKAVMIALHHGTNRSDGRHRTKNRKSVRMAYVAEPFGSWLIWEACAHEDLLEPLCPMSLGNYGTRWRGYFAEPSTSKHTRAAGVYKGRLHGLPYIPLSRMRATHSSIMQAAGVPDPWNSAVHAHSESIAKEHYMRAQIMDATIMTSRYLSNVNVQSLGTVLWNDMEHSENIFNKKQARHTA